MAKKPSRRKQHGTAGPENNDGVGFCNPPKSTQFKKGQSGNPKGRPKKKPIPIGEEPPDTLEKALERLLSEDVNVTHQGKKKTLPKIDVILRSLEKQAFNGGAYATKLLLDYVQNLERKKNETYQDELGFKERINANREKYLAHCRKYNKPVEEFWLQDEDMIVRHGQPMWIRGPVTEEDVPFYERLKWLRNLLILEQTCRVVFKEQTEIRPTGDNILVRYFGQHLSQQQFLESNAYFDMIWSKAQIDDWRWLKKERDQVWTRIIGSAPEKFVHWLELTAKELKQIGFSAEEISRMRRRPG